MKKKGDKLKSEKKLEGKQEGVKKWKRGEKKEKGFGLASETGSTLALSLPLRLYQFARFGKSVRGFPLVFGQPGQKLMIYPIHERYIFHTPFHGFLTTMSLPDAHQIFSGCRSHIRIISRQFVTQNEKNNNNNKNEKPNNLPKAHSFEISGSITQGHEGYIHTRLILFNPLSLNLMTADRQCRTPRPILAVL